MKTLTFTLLVVFLINLVVGSAFAMNCPMPSSQEENEVILEEGTEYLRTGRAGFCLEKILAREKKLNPRVLEEDLLNSLMNASLKALSESEAAQ